MRVSDLVLDPNNVNQHDERSIAALMRSLKEFGQQKTVVVDSNNTVKAGNGLVLAAMRLCWREIQVNRTDLTGPKLEAYAIADNKTAKFSDFDNSKLLDMLKKIEVDNESLLAGGLEQELRDHCASVNVEELLGATGFSEDDRKRLEASMNVIPPRADKGDAEGGADGLDESEGKFGVVVPCSSEESQLECYNAMVALGYTKARKLRT